MALILKQDKTYKTPQGSEITTAYLTLTEVFITKKQADIRGKIFLSKEARLGKATEVAMIYEQVSGQEFRDYFMNSDKVANVFQQAYPYLLAMTVKVMGEDDEEIDVLKYADWQSDQ